MMKLYSYWRSSAAYRVRIALDLKGLDYETAGVDLRAGQQSAPDYKAINPQGLVPALDTGETLLTQSTAILEWLEETHPAPALLPCDAIARAQVRAMMAIVTCDIHPLNNLRVLNSLKADLNAGEAETHAWISRWITAGFDALEAMIGRQDGRFAFGDSPTLADCCLIPQLYNARRFHIDLSPWPRIVAVDAACTDLPAFARAHPQAQPDADAA